MPPKDLLIGRTVRINDDASTPRGACPFAGQDALVTARTPGGRQYQLRVGETLVNLPMSEFAVPKAEAAAPPVENTAPISALAPSRTNRPVREDDELLTMAATIKVMGILQPILVRPLPAARLQDTFESPETRKAQYEIIAGERRFHAAKIAGLKAVPILVREADDAHALVMQLVENLHRKDLNPLEEARGLQRLIDEHSYTREDAAEAVNKSRTHVFESLRLLSICPEALTALERGTLNRSLALLIAQRPTLAMQAEFCKRVLTEGPDGGPLSYRSAQDLARRNYMTDLAQAPFALDDAELVHKAGSCAACPKRTGANPELWDNKNGADICTDTVCFASKKDAHYERMQRQAQERGQKVIAGREAREILPTDNGTPAGYMLLDKPSQGSNAPLRQVLGQDVPAGKVVLIETPSGGFVEAVSTRAAGAALEAKGKEKAEKSKAKAEAELTNEELAAEYQRRWRAAALQKVISILRDENREVNLPHLPPTIAYRVMLALADSTNDCSLQSIFELEAHFGDDDLRIAIREAAEAGPETVNRVLVMLAADVDRYPLFERPENEAVHLDAAATVAMVGLGAIKAGVEREMNKEAAERAAANAKAKAAAPADGAKPTPKATPKAKPKATAAEASSAIAEAMQAAENPNNFAVGDEVRLLVDLKNIDGKLAKTNGETGLITDTWGSRAWLLDCPSLNTQNLIADYTEMEKL